MKDKISRIPWVSISMILVMLAAGVWAIAQSYTTTPGFNGVFVSGNFPGTGSSSRQIGLGGQSTGPVTCLWGLGGEGNATEGIGPACSGSISGFGAPLVAAANLTGSGVFTTYVLGTPTFNFSTNGLVGGNGMAYGWTSTVVPSTSISGDTQLARASAGIVQATGAVEGTSVTSITGCTVSAVTANNHAGRYTSGTAGTCTVTVTFSVTATNGWSCQANDQTTVADLQHQTSNTTTTAVISGTTASGDVININCGPF